MTTQLVLKNKCTFRLYTMITNLAGQKVQDITNYTDTDVPCSFQYTQVKEILDPVEKDETIIELIIDDFYTPSYSAQVINLRDRYSNIIEAGPLQIHEIKKYQGFTGQIHHYTITTRVLRNC